MIDSIFGPEDNTIEVCSNNSAFRAFTVDINPDHNPNLVDDAQFCSKIEDNRFQRWRADPPYSIKRANGMYNTDLPNPYKLLEAGARVCKPGALLLLLLGPQNYQRHPPTIRRIGWIAITVIPNNELRALHIFYKLPDQVQLVKPDSLVNLHSQSNLNQ